MNREIKFRYWETKYQVMVNEVTLIGLHWGSCKDPAVYTGENFKYEREDGNIGTVPYYSNGVVMQYTGLKDSNGKEIYEGDVVTARQQSDMAPFTGYVHYLNAQYWVNHIGYESYYVPLIQLHGAVYKTIEVIGNIYEHEHLLLNATEEDESK